MLLFIMIFAAAQAPAPAQREQQLAEERLHDLYGPAAQIRTQTVSLSDSLRNAIAHLAGVPYRAATVKVQCLTTADGLRVYAIVDNVFGKEQFITYMVAFDDGEKIKAVEILVYREAYGNEVAYKSFRMQFEDKQYNDDIRIGGGIRNITGATISSHAVTTGVRKVAALFHVIRSLL